MTIELTPQQLPALDSRDSGAPRVIDPRSNTAYVLISEAEYEAVREIIEEERRRRSIHAAAIRNAIGRMDETP